MIDVLIVDDQPIVRAGLPVVLDAEPDLHAVGQAQSGAEAIGLAAQLRPGVVCMDVRMPGMDGIAATRRIVAADEGAKVLILTTFDVDEDVFAALEVGASGFLLKGAEAPVTLRRSGRWPQGQAHSTSASPSGSSPSSPAEAAPLHPPPLPLGLPGRPRRGPLRQGITSE